MKDYLISFVITFLGSMAQRCPCSMGQQAISSTSRVVQL